MKLLRRSIVLAIAIALFFVLGGLVIPRLIDSQLIRNRISSEFSSRFDQNPVIGKISLSWFPQPVVVIEHAQLFFGENQQASIPAVKIYPSLFDLLFGRLNVARAVLIDPNLKIRLKPDPEKPFNLEEIEKKIAAVIVSLSKDFPALHIAVDSGSAEITSDEKPPVILQDVSAIAAVSSGEVGFDLSSRSSLWQHLTIKGKVSVERFEFQLDVAVQRLKINDAVGFLPFDDFESTPEGNASFDLVISGAGLRRIKASIVGFPEPLVVSRRGRSAVFQIKQLKGLLSIEDGAYDIDVDQFELASPRLSASGQIRFQSDRVSASVKARDLDIAEVGGLIRRAVDNAEDTEKILRSMPAGTISELHIQSVGRSFAELASAKNIVLSGMLRNCRILIPAFDLELDNVDAAVRVDEGQLQADRVSLRLGGMQGRSGVLRLGLQGRPAPFHLDIGVNAGAAELLGVLQKVAQDDGVRAELLKLRNAEGKLSGKLILDKSVDAFSAEVSISKANVSAEYEPVPFPIAVHGGRFHYGENIVRIKDARGAVGNSQFDAVGITFHRDGNRRLEIESKRASLDLRQAETFVRTFRSLPPQFQKLTAARGRAELAAFTLAGPYGAPSQWSFAVTGSLEHVAIQHVDLPGPLSVMRAKFEANQQRVLFSDAEATISDATLFAGGKFEYQSEKPAHVEMSGRATVGERMIDHLSRSVELPEDLRLRAPLEIVAERLTWTAGVESSFVGQLDLAGGSLLKVDAVKGPRKLVLNNVTFDDLERRARLTLRLADDHIAFSFNGELTEESIERVFVSFPMKGGSLRGDLQVSAAPGDPVTMSASGELSGSNVIVPFRDEQALVKKFSIEASGKSLLVRSADLRWRNSHMTISGKVGVGKEAWSVDLDASADRLRLDELSGLFGESKKNREGTDRRRISPPAIEGRLGLQLDSFVTEHFTIAGLQVNTAFSGSSVRAEVKRGAICGINTVGHLEAVEGEIDLDLRFSATDADLEPTTVCLTNERNVVKGNYSLSARIAGRGSRENLRSALTGNFQMSARDGEFVRSSGLDAAFDYLNESGDFDVVFPDLNKKAFAYRLLAAKGNIEGQRIQSEEIFIHASPLTIAAQGSFDLQEKQVDLKGLVSVALPAHQVIKRIPFIGALLGGSLVGIPVRIKGAFDGPEVSYLSPMDVGAELVNIPLRVLGMPLDAMKVFIP